MVGDGAVASLQMQNSSALQTPVVLLLAISCAGDGSHEGMREECSVDRASDPKCLKLKKQPQFFVFAIAVLEIL